MIYKQLPGFEVLTAVVIFRVEEIGSAKPASKQVAPASQITTDSYNLEISPKKTKVMAFRGKCPVREKIIINDKTVEQFQDSNYLGCDISYSYDNDLEHKLSRM
jgi:hypothetical protein